MKVNPALLGTILLGCAGLLISAGSPPSQAPTVPAAAPAQVRPAAPAAAEPAKAPSPEETSLRNAFQTFVKAYNASDVESLAALFDDEAEVIDSVGEKIRGREAIAGMYAGAFQETPGVRLESAVDEIRFLTRDVARIEGHSKLSTGTGDASQFTRFSALAVRRDGKWRVAEPCDIPVPVEDVEPYERLKELEWMVGDWVDEGADMRVRASIRWADNNSYLVRTYSVEREGRKATSGTMFIGWDPQSGQIKSWLFDSEGGHGEGLWTRTAENEWVVKAQGVLRDGRPTSATQIHVIMNKDAVKTNSIDRIIGGQVAADIPDVVMVRKPPAPGAAPARPAAGGPEGK